MQFAIIFVEKNLGSELVVCEAGESVHLKRYGDDDDEEACYLLECSADYLSILCDRLKEVYGEIYYIGQVV